MLFRKPDSDEEHTLEMSPYTKQLSFALAKDLPINFHWYFQQTFSAYMYASPTKCTQVGRGVRMQKKKKKMRPKWVWHLTLLFDSLAFDLTQRSLHHVGATHVLTFCSCQKGSFHKFAVFL